jgi:16S rRNA (guanine966-N2)-methyltransferase
MNLRIIAGKFGGRTIQAPDGRITHPMGDRIRGSLFSIIGSEFENAEVLDTFAGTGSLGLESLSRGAKSVVFVERDRVAGRILTENIQSLGVDDKITTYSMGVSTWIDKNQGNFYDIIFADPPYNNLQLSTVARLGGLLKPNGLMVLSYPGKGEVPPVNGIVVVDNRSYGTASLAFYRKK